MTVPLLSIAIPTYNRAAELRQLLDSIVRQMIDGVEVVVSDNGSTDGTVALMASYMAGNSAIRYVRHPVNMGIDRNVDSAVENSRGTHVWLCGDDDELEVGAVAHILGVLAQGNFAGGWINYSSWDSRLERCERQSTAAIDADLVDADMGDVLRVAHFFFSFLSTHIVRRDLWLAAEDRKKSFAPPFTDCIWMLGHLLACMGRKQFVIARPMLRQRASVYDPKIVAERPIALNWCEIVLIAVQLGVSQRDAEPFFREMVNGGHLTRNILFKMRFSPPAARREMWPTIRIFWRYPAFWVTVVPLYMMPAAMVRLVQRGYRAIWRLSGYKYIEGG